MAEKAKSERSAVSPTRDVVGAVVLAFLIAIGLTALVFRPARPPGGPPVREPRPQLLDEPPNPDLRPATGVK